MAPEKDSGAEAFPEFERIRRGVSDLDAQFDLGNLCSIRLSYGDSAASLA